MEAGLLVPFSPSSSIEYVESSMVLGTGSTHHFSSPILSTSNHNSPHLHQTRNTRPISLFLNPKRTSIKTSTPDPESPSPPWSRRPGATVSPSPPQPPHQPTHSDRSEPGYEQTWKEDKGQ